MLVIDKSCLRHAMILCAIQWVIHVHVLARMQPNVFSSYRRQTSGLWTDFQDESEALCPTELDIWQETLSVKMFPSTLSQEVDDPSTRR